MRMDDDAALPVSPNETAPSNRINVDLLSDADYAVHIDQVHAATKARHGVADRVCGDCTACCTVMGVRELNKASYQACPHNCGKSCGIYTSRPRNCHKFCCLWLLGLVEGDERRRPDRLGLIFNREGLSGKPITVVCEVWPGAGKEANNAYLLRKMSQKMPIVLREYQTEKNDVLTPDVKLREHILQLIASEWQQNGYGQVLVTNFPATQSTPKPG
jgi:hypothetical protein